MTATNHAVTGALIAMVIPNPLVAIATALLSHFVLDALPHYNPPQITKKTFRGFKESWERKFSYRSFRIIFSVDMFLLLAILIILPLATAYEVSSWVVLASSVAAISPDFVGGRFLVYKFIRTKRRPSKSSLFTRFHIWVQWLETPWGIWVEAVWLLLISFLIFRFYW